MSMGKNLGEMFTRYVLDSIEDTTQFLTREESFADVRCYDNFDFRHLLRHVEMCHSVSATGRNLEQSLYITRTPQECSSSGVLKFLMLDSLN